MKTILELLVTCAAVAMPIVTLAAFLSGKRARGVVAFMVSLLSIFILAFAMGIHSQTREARRRFHSKVAQPHRLIVSHLQSLAERGPTNQLRHALEMINQHELRLFPDRVHPKPELIDVFRELHKQQEEEDIANKKVDPSQKARIQAF